ncbi:hypothetical protein P9A14_11070 [Gordonia hongkongensis]|uniref:TPR repeat domain-containing protein n=2 Tax=Gordonia TaxID=2053 RepID=A0AAX3TCT5_9ACTN|nr:MULTISPECIES: hypothetical protein [Gordonia]OCH79594.1 hypothetical protein A9310_07050 [Gordonia sp. UCD-TK1]QIK48162.1 hypothetical protein G8C36_13670 [Gordonia terrae]UCZ90549.1 hypothetical protein LEL84_02300 [Gordonia sp. WA4-43]WFP26975.1 hypothetical protein P9A14_11070 [Gordonia hongkongensis]
MSRPSRSVVNGWDLMSLDAVATALDAAVDDLRDLTQRMAEAPMKAGDSKGWVGDSQRGCETRTDSDRTEINKLGADITRAATALRDTSSAISPNRTTALVRALGLERDEFSVADDWTVRDTRDYAAELKGVEAGSATERSILDAQAARAEEAKTATLSLHSLADQMGEDDRNGARVLAAAFGDAEGNAPLASSYSPGQASIDVQAIMSGSATKEQKDRFFRATSLTAEQRAALARGDFAEISKEQFDYLKAIYTPSWGGGPEGQPLSLDALKSFGDRYIGAERENLKRGLGDGVYLLGNPNLRTRQTDSNSIAEVLGTNTPLVAGGLNQLPAPIRDLLSGPAASKASISNDPSGVDGSRMIEVTRLGSVDDFNDLMDVLEHRSEDSGLASYGSQSVQLGSDVDRAIIARASEIAGGDVNERYITDRNETISHPSVERLLDRMLGVAGSDHIAVHDAVVGATGGSHSSMPAVHSLDGGEKPYDPSLAMKELFQFDWADKAGREHDGINRLFNWMPEVASTPDGVSAERMADGVRSGQIASELARIIAENKSDFEDMNGGSASLGEVNPELTRTLARAVSPFLAELAEVDPTLFDTRGVTALGEANQFKSLFQILTSDPEAGRVMNTSALWQANVLEQVFGSDPERTDLGEKVARLHGGMTAGMNAMLDEDTADRRYDAARDYALHGAAFDSVKSLATGIPGLSPAIKGAIDIAAPSLKLDVTGLPPNPEDVGSATEFASLRASLYKNTDLDLVYREMLEGYISSHPEFLETDSFRSIYGSQAYDQDFLDSVAKDGLPPGWDGIALKSVVQELVGARGSYFFTDYNNQLARMNDKNFADGAGW